jgi:hypothetical protein
MERRATRPSPCIVAVALVLAWSSPMRALAQDAVDVGVISDDPAAEPAVAQLADALRAEGVRVHDASAVRAASAFLGPGASLRDPQTLSALRQRLELDRVVSIWRDPESGAWRILAVDAEYAHEHTSDPAVDGTDPAIARQLYAALPAPVEAAVPAVDPRYRLSGGREPTSGHGAREDDAEDRAQDPDEEGGDDEYEDEYEEEDAEPTYDIVFAIEGLLSPMDPISGGGGVALSGPVVSFDGEGKVRLVLSGTTGLVVGGSQGITVLSVPLIARAGIRYQESNFFLEGGVGGAASIAYSFGSIAGVDVSSFGVGGFFDVGVLGGLRLGPVSLVVSLDVLVASGAGVLIGAGSAF